MLAQSLASLSLVLCSYLLRRHTSESLGRVPIPGTRHTEAQATPRLPCRALCVRGYDQRSELLRADVPLIHGSGCVHTARGSGK